MRQRYSKKEAINRILRSLEGEPPASDAPETLVGDLLSEDEAVSDIAELLLGSLPNESGILPAGIRNRPSVYGDSKEFFVIPDHPSASDSNTGENPAQPLSTIQQAVTNCRAYRGDVIWVTSSDSWQYGAGSETGVVENVTIPATKPGISIIGVGRGSLGTYWQPVIEGSGSFCLVINALDVTVDGFCFWSSGGEGNGIFCNWSGPPYGENSVIANCTFTDDLNIGIQMEYAWFIDIYNNKFQECNTYGIFVDPLGSGIEYERIFGNWFNDCGVTMQLGDCSRTLIYNNYIYQVNAQATGSCTNLGILTASGTYNQVFNNYFGMPLAAWDAFNSSAATDAWVNNHCMDGPNTTNPA